MYLNTIQRSRYASASGDCRSLSRYVDKYRLKPCLAGALHACGDLVVQPIALGQVCEQLSDTWEQQQREFENIFSDQTDVVHSKQHQTYPHFPCKRLKSTFTYLSTKRCKRVFTSCVEKSVWCEEKAAEKRAPKWS